MAPSALGSQRGLFALCTREKPKRSCCGTISAPTNTPRIALVLDAARHGRDERACQRRGGCGWSHVASTQHPSHLAALPTHSLPAPMTATNDLSTTPKTDFAPDRSNQSPRARPTRSGGIYMAAIAADGFFHGTTPNTRAHAVASALLFILISPSHQRSAVPSLLPRTTTPPPSPWETRPAPSSSASTP